MIISNNVSFSEISYSSLVARIIYKSFTFLLMKLETLVLNCRYQFLAKMKFDFVHSLGEDYIIYNVFYYIIDKLY
jgi:hypothetical protein